ncbi:MAG: DoxX family protein [Citrobacter freundii]|nr:MAG: DoxX family protein [Citrobacter freundii]
MKKALKSITSVYPGVFSFHLSMLVFRVLVSVELMMAHGLKKVGVGVAQAETIPNPLHLPAQLNDLFATSANLFFPVLVIIGFFTRIAVIPVLAVTLTGYFVVHWNDSLLEKDTPFMYSVSFLLIMVLGPGKYSLDHFLNKRLSQTQ